MHIVVVGLNHKSAPIELRERLAFGKERLPETLPRLQQQTGVQEAAILSTCNRVEIYAAVPELNGAVDRLQRFLSEHGRMALEGLTPRLYSLTEPLSVRHLFAVASGLDSMLLGEHDILHQVKHAYESAQAHGAAGKLFHALFQRALNTGKAVRSQTAIGRGSTSIGAVSIELAGKIFGHLSTASVLLVGAGKIGEATLGRLTERGVRTIRILNRSADRARELAQAYGGSSGSLDMLPNGVLEADLVMTSTSASTPLLTRQVVSEVMHRRHQRPLCLIDLGVPRNVEPSVGALENVYLFNIDDLQGVIAHSQQERRKALQASEAIVDAKVDRFLSWWQGESQPCSPSYSARAAAH